MNENDIPLWVQFGQNLEGWNISQQKFGKKVAMSADSRRVVVSGTSDYYTDERGLVRVFECDDQSGTNEWKKVGLDIVGEELEDRFGVSVDMSNDGKIIIAGARFNDGNGKIRVGHDARVFQDVDGQWVQVGQDLDGRRNYTGLGQSVTISGDGKRAILGGPGFTSQTYY